MGSTHFTFAYWCVLFAALLPLLCAGLAKSGGFGKAPQQGGYDNAAPRAWMAQQQGWHARANAAQANSFEALPFFIGAVVIAHQLQANQTVVDILAFLFIFLRLLYIMLYVANQATLRSIVWNCAFVANIGILFCGYR